MERSRHLGVGTGAFILALVLLVTLGVVMPSGARADTYWMDSVSVGVVDGHGAPAQGVPFAYWFDDWMNPDEGVVVTGADGHFHLLHAGFEDNGFGFSGMYTLSLNDPHGVYSLTRTESEASISDPGYLYLYKTYYLADAGVISGIVRDGDGTPMRDVEVTLFVAGIAPPPGKIASVRSDANGAYRFAALGSRTYAVRFAYPAPYGPRFWLGDEDPASAGLIVLGQDQARLDIDGEPGPLLTSSLAGRVITRSGSAFEGVVVRAWQLTDDRSLTELPAPTATDEQGAYVVEDLAPGTYTVSLDLGQRYGGIRWLGDAHDLEHASFVTVDGDDHVDGLDFVMPRGILRGPHRAAR